MTANKHGNGRIKMEIFMNSKLYSKSGYLRLKFKVLIYFFYSPYISNKNKRVI